MMLQVPMWWSQQPLCSNILQWPEVPLRKKINVIWGPTMCQAGATWLDHHHSRVLSSPSWQRSSEITKQRETMIKQFNLSCLPGSFFPIISRWFVKGKGRKTIYTEPTRAPSTSTKHLHILLTLIPHDHPPDQVSTLLHLSLHPLTYHSYPFHTYRVPRIVLYTRSSKKYGTFQVAQWVKNPLTMQETQEMGVRSLGWEDPLEEGKATHSSFLGWRIP